MKKNKNTLIDLYQKNEEYLNKYIFTGSKLSIPFFIKFLFCKKR
jgi:hypothetical protein